MPLSVASLHIHPIKSLGGFGVSQAHITPRGFAHDRRWMLVDGTGVFMTQRELPGMATLHCSPRSDGFRVTDTRDNEHMDLSWEIDQGERRRARIWKDDVQVVHAPVEVSAWFADRLGVTCSLVHMPESTHRPINPAYARGVTALNDGYPYMILSSASVDDLNARMERPLPMDRFRPSIVIGGGAPYQEDDWKEITIGSARFQLVKPCERCAITTTDQRTGERGKEPLRTLAIYRKRGNEVAFGMNAVAVAGARINVGDTVTP
jgi:uncharacterized protein YcbX